MPVWVRFTVVRLFAVLATLVAFGKVAAADQSGGHTVPVAVLAFDSEDAEDQADAFTGALRSRVRAAQGWSLSETTQSLGMLTAALKCPSRPPPDCQQKIADHLKSERYIWGHVTKGPQAGQVTAEIHLFQKGKPDTLIRESYAENLKDQNDENLRRVAQRVLDRLSGNAVGVVVVRGPDDMSGEVVVDGEKRVPLEDGSARIELAAGSHAIEVTPTNGAPTKRTVLVTAGKESLVEIEAPAPAEPVEPERPFPTKKVVGGIAFGTGIIAAAVAVQQFIFWNELQSRGDDIKGRVQSGLAPCEGSAPDREFCDTHKKAQTSSAVAIGAAGLAAVGLGVGTYLLFVDGGSSEQPKDGWTARRRPRVSPTFGPHGGGLSVSGAF